MEKSSHTKGVFRKVKFTALCGILTVLFVTNNESYSFFSKSSQDQMQVTSASAENLVSNVEILEQQDGSLVIQITRDSEYGYRPDVGFVIEGELANYILHINPVTIDVNGVYEIPIEPNLNTYQFLDLLRLKYSQQDSNIPGLVTVKNFDGKIIDSKEIEISIDYLLSRIDDPIIRSNANDFQYNQIDDFEMANVTKLITNIAGQINWENGMMHTMERTPTDTLTPHQMEIIRAVAPSLIGNADALYYELTSMQQENAELKHKIDALNIVLEELMNRVPENPIIEAPKSQVPENPVIEVPENEEAEDPEIEMPENEEPEDPVIEVPINIESENTEPNDLVTQFDK